MAMAGDMAEDSYCVSVIIPAYNAELCIGRAIESVLRQTAPVHQIIVINDGSTDNTEEVVKGYRAQVTYLRQENAGQSVARNKGIAAATGNWIAFLDADDEWLPTKNQRQIELLKRNRDLLCCSANYERCYGDRRGASFGIRAIEAVLGHREYFENYFLCVVRAKCRADTPTTMCHKSLFEQYGAFEAGRSSGEDLDLWWRFFHRHPKIGYIAEPLAVVHLDVHDPVHTRRRLEAKRGINARELIGRHVQLARELGVDEAFERFAGKYVRKILLTTLVHGFKEDARVTVRQFRELLPWHWQVATYVLTVCPRLTSLVAKNVVRLAEVVGLQREVTRRGNYPRAGREI